MGEQENCHPPGKLPPNKQPTSKLLPMKISFYENSPIPSTKLHPVKIALCELPPRKLRFSKSPLMKISLQ